jgi:hypothetical protein
MRIEGGGRAAGGDGTERAGRFGEALARAGGDERHDARAEARGQAEPGSPRRRGRPTAADDGPDGAGTAGASGADARGAALRPAHAPGKAAEVPPAPELARAIRVVPPAAAILGPAGGAPLTLSFGRSLDVELRATAAGVEVVLRPEPALARAAEAELPRLAAALRVRGVAVARVEIRARPPSGGRAR